MVETGHFALVLALALALVQGPCRCSAQGLATVG